MCSPPQVYGSASPAVLFLYSLRSNAGELLCWQPEHSLKPWWWFQHCDMQRRQPQTQRKWLFQYEQNSAFPWCKTTNLPSSGPENGALLNSTLIFALAERPAGQSWLKPDQHWELIVEPIPNPHIYPHRHVDCVYSGQGQMWLEKDAHWYLWKRRTPLIHLTSNFLPLCIHKHTNASKAFAHLEKSSYIPVSQIYLSLMFQS